MLLLFVSVLGLPFPLEPQSVSAGDQWDQGAEASFANGRFVEDLSIRPTQEQLMAMQNNWRGSQNSAFPSQSGQDQWDQGAEAAFNDGKFVEDVSIRPTQEELMAMHNTANEDAPLDNQISEFSQTIDEGTSGEDQWDQGAEAAFNDGKFVEDVSIRPTHDELIASSRFMDTPSNAIPAQDNQTSLTISKVNQTTAAKVNQTSNYLNDKDIAGIHEELLLNNKEIKEGSAVGAGMGLLNGAVAGGLRAMSTGGDVRSKLITTAGGAVLGAGLEGTVGAIGGSILKAYRAHELSVQLKLQNKERSMELLNSA